MCRFVLLLGLLAFWGASAAKAEKRIALVIGNSAYQNTTELKNPRNDAQDMAAALGRLGFEVLEGRDLDKRSMERLIRQFGVKMTGADLALFFYAGHGLAIGGQNYLVPVDARLASEGDADFEGLGLSLVLKQMEREAKTSIVLLDACRDNPLARNLARHMGTRSSQVSQGLAEVKTGVGTLIGFSTQPGNVAIDGAGRNSPYAQALLRHIEVRGKDVSGVLIAVRNDVLKDTEGRQVPWEHTSLTGQVFLKFDPSITTGSAIAPPTAASDREIELSFWNSVKDSKSPAMLESYLERYPNGSFSGLARVMVDQLKVAAAPAVGPSVALQDDPLELTRSIQSELRRVGCHSGAVDGKWEAKSKAALGKFARFAKVEMATSSPSVAILDALKAHQSPVCPLECAPGKVEVGGRCIAKAAPAPAAKAPSADAPARRPRQDAGGGKGGTCWAQDGRHLVLVPCSDSRATTKAY